ncbi:MAG: ABC transporter substrate-binding protein [Acidobacteriota bacterium]
MERVCLRRLFFVFTLSSLLAPPIIGQVDIASVWHDVGLKVGLCDIPTSVDPHRHHTQWTESLFSPIFEKLTEFDADGELQPGLAVDWHWVTPTSLRLRLRPDVRFHDGRLVTARDVMASLLRARDYPNGRLRARLTSVVTVGSPAPDLIEIEVAAPTPSLPRQLGFIGIVPADSPRVIEHPIGSGPYRWVRHEPGVGVRLRAFTEHRGPSPAHADAAFLFFPSADACADALIAGTVDLAEVPANRVEVVDATPGLWIHSRVSPGVRYLAFKQEPPFDDVHLRRAIDRAIDRKRLSDARHGLARPANQLAGPASGGYVDAVDVVPFEPEPAKELVAELPAELRRVELLYSNGSASLVEGIVTDLEALGFEVDAVSGLPGALMDRLARGEFQLFLGGWLNNIHDLGDVYANLVQCERGIFRFGDAEGRGHCDPVLDVLLETVSSELDAERRQRALHAATLVIRDAAPMVPLVWDMVTYGSREDTEWQVRSDHRLNPAEVGRPGAR